MTGLITTRTVCGAVLADRRLGELPVADVHGYIVHVVQEDAARLGAAAGRDALPNRGR